MPYFHIVFTVPQQIEVIAFQNQTVVYDILFRAASETLRKIAADPKHLGAEIGFLGVLHTWGQSLQHHPHVHFLVPGGGIAPDGESWVACRPGFFLPVTVLSSMFRGLFLHYLTKAFTAGALNFFSAHRHLHEPAAFRRYLTPVWNTDWVVYAKRPFAGPAQVLDYVGRYTHRVAISNNRLLSMDNGKVRFRWKDYRDGNRQKTMTLDGQEFIRRFLIHVLPDGFHRIRYYGFLGNCHRARKLERCRELLGMAPSAPAEPPADYRDRFEALTGRSLRECPRCEAGIMVVIGCVTRSRVCQLVPDTPRQEIGVPTAPCGNSLGIGPGLLVSRRTIGRRHGRKKVKFRPVLPVRAPGCRGNRLPGVAQSVPMARPRRDRGHSTPIAQTLGGAV